MNGQTKNNIGKFVGWIAPLVLGFLIAWVILKFIVSPVQVSGTSMYPNLEDKESLVLLHQAKVKHGSVIVFDAFGEDPEASQNDSIYIKRVIGLPGDSIKYERGKLLVNGKETSQEYLKDDSEQLVGSGTTWDLKELADSFNWSSPEGNVVPKGCYFVMGDHRSNSNDSRYWGFVKASKVKGVAKVAPWSKSTPEHKSYINAFASKLN